jgi:hypothetical protein
MVITSIRDGMNLVAQEYIAAQQHKHGVLILSEFAGVWFLVSLLCFYIISVCVLYSFFFVFLFYKSLVRLTFSLSLHLYISVVFQLSKRGKCHLHFEYLTSIFPFLYVSIPFKSLLVNPWNLEETADAMFQALSLSPDERAAKHKHLFQYISTHSAARYIHTLTLTLLLLDGERPLSKNWTECPTLMSKWS